MALTLDQALRGAGRIRFLCSGNVVRSAFAELYARHLGCPLEVDSAATTFQNASIFEETRQALRSRGVDAAWIEAFRPRHLSLLPEPPPDLLLLGMTQAHLSHWRRLHPGHEGSFLLSELEQGKHSIADPVTEGVDFERTFSEIARLVEVLLGRLGRQG